MTGENQTRVTLVCGPRHLRPAIVEQHLADAPLDTTIVRLSSRADPVMARCTVELLLARVADERQPERRYLIVLEDPKWLRRDQAGMPPLNRAIAELIRRPDAQVTFLASMNPSIVTHGEMAAALMHRATRVLVARPDGVRHAGRMMPEGISTLIGQIAAPRPLPATLN